MKKFIFIFIIICTSFSYAENISERNDVNIIINSKKIFLSLPPISYNNYTLVPLKDILPSFNIPKENISYSDKNISLKRYNSILTLYINNTLAYIDNTQIQLYVPPILYQGTIYIPLRVISDFYDCYIYYDNNSKTIFIKDLNEYEQVINFFKKVQNTLNSVNSLQIDIISELKNEISSYSFGNSFYISKTADKILKKDMLESNWEESNQKIKYTQNNFSSEYNNNFFTGLSFDRKKSSQTQMVFYGFYPYFSNLCETTFYINPDTLYITKQENNYKTDNLSIKQTTLYTYN